MNLKTQKTERPPREKKSKEEVQLLRRNTGTKIARIVLWAIFLLIFARGVISIVKKPDTGDALTREQLAAYTQDLAEQRSAEEGLLPFAEDFAREYLTYTVGADEDYRARVGRYAVSSVATERRAGGEAAADYVTAYRKEAYSATQWDVWVRAGVTYTTRREPTEDEGTGDAVTRITRNVTLKVPVAVMDGGYIVEDHPAFVAAEPLPNYAQEGYSGQSATQAELTELRQALDSFFTAYYAGDQGVIRHYLAPGADEAGFRGLDGTLTYSGIGSVQGYRLAEDDYLAVCQVQLTAPDGQRLPQGLTLRLRRSAGQYYVAGMDTRTKNINIEEDTQK